MPPRALLVLLALLASCVAKPGYEVRTYTFTLEEVRPAGELFFAYQGPADALGREIERVLEGEEPERTFEAGREINFVVFRGVFRTGGYGIRILDVRLGRGPSK
jgi:hypothetical protein